MAPATVRRIAPVVDPDISHREMMDALDENLNAMEGRLTERHEALEGKVDSIAGEVTEVRLSVARIEGAREAEQRLSPSRAQTALTLGAAVALGSGITTIVTGWPTISRVLAAINGALIR
jgi:hypothetical protein